MLIACAAANEPAAAEVIRELGLDCRLVRNRGELMILPAGVTKGAGLTEALDDMGLSRHNAIGVGDAENDHSLLDACEIGSPSPTRWTPSARTRTWCCLRPTARA